MQSTDQPPRAPAEFDPSLKFIRPTQFRDDGFVEFTFAIGEPELALDLILPIAAFHEFCRDSNATHLPPIQPSASARKE